MQMPVDVRCSIRATRDLPHHRTLFQRVHEQPLSLGFAEHPPQRNLRESPLRLWISTANIAVHTREPDLKQIFRASFRRIHVWSPQLRTEERSALVDRDGVPTERDIGIARD